MAGTPSNAINASTAGIVGFDGTATFTGTAVTQYNLLAGGSANDTISNIAPSATSGTILQSQGSSANPAYSTASYPATTTANDILYSSSANVVGQITTNNRAVLTTTTGQVPAWRVIGDGQVIIGATSGNPAAGNISAGAGIVVTNGANTISIAGTGGGFTWTDVTGGSATVAAQNGYLADKSTLTTFTLPTNNAIGDTILIVGVGTGGWKIVYTTNQKIIFGSSTSTVSTGNVASTNTADCCTLICTTASASAPIFTITNAVGNLTVA